MEPNKVVILAYDALDPFLVRRFRLPHLRQEHCGIVDNRSFPLLSTPIIWASFITGLPPRLHGVGKSKKWKVPVLERLLPLLEKAPRVSDMLAVLKARLGVFSYMEKPYDKEHYREKGIKTIFDYAENPFCFDVPSYNQSEVALRLRGCMMKVLDGKMEAADYERLLRRYHHLKARLLLKAVASGEHDLVMVHFELSDAMGHLFISNHLKMLNVYTLLDRLARRVREMLPPGGLLLIVSDHGMRPFQVYKGHKGRFGDHSPFGFWSANLPLKLPERVTMTDFFGLIVERLTRRG